MINKYDDWFRRAPKQPDLKAVINEIKVAIENV